MSASTPEPSKQVPTEQPPLDQASCANCQAGIERTYFKANGRVVCPKCRIGLATPSKEGGGERFLRALGLGVLAGVLGGVIWFGVAAATGYQLGFIAIIVGLLVGGAVRKGSNARGGWGYQILAMALTYLTVAGASAPLVVMEYDKQAAGQLPPQEMEDSAAPSMRTVGPSALTATPPPPHRKPPLPRVFVILGAIVAGFAMPFLGGIMSVVIFGIALYEAWKINKRARIFFDGPFALGAPAPAVAPPAST
jgi:hypothetical protein